MTKVEDLKPGKRFRVSGTAYTLCRGGHHDHDGRLMVPVIQEWSGRRVHIDSEMPIDVEEKKETVNNKKKTVLIKKR
jgi:hypothetical protein